MAELTKKQLSEQLATVTAELEQLKQESQDWKQKSLESSQAAQQAASNYAIALQREADYEQETALNKAALESAKSQLIRSESDLIRSESDKAAIIERTGALRGLLQWLLFLVLLVTLLGLVIDLGTISEQQQQHELLKRIVHVIENPPAPPVPTVPPVPKAPTDEHNDMQLPETYKHGGDTGLPPTLPTSHSLWVKASESCWLRVSEAIPTEPIAFEGNVKAGWNRTFSFGEEVSVEVRSGCPGKLVYVVNGNQVHPVNVSGTPEQSEVVKMSF